MDTTKEYLNKLKQQQEDEDFDAELRDVEPEYQLDLSKLQPVKHNWVVRGCVLSCEGSNHPNHRHFIINKENKS
jgi:hypothetical protein